MKILPDETSKHHWEVVEYNLVTEVMWAMTPTGKGILNHLENSQTECSKWNYSGNNSIRDVPAVVKFNFRFLCVFPHL